MSVDPTGERGPTRGQAHGPGWRRTSHGRYVPAAVDPAVPEQRILEQAARLTGGAVTGWAACRLHGAAFFDGLARDGRTPPAVPLCCGPLHPIRRRAGDDLRRDILHPPAIVVVQGIACTVPERATFDAMRYCGDVREAVVALDMMAAARLTSVARMRAYVDRHPAWTGVQLARDAVALADEHSRSPQESRFRLVWQLDAGRARPRVNPALFGLDGTLLGVPDLLDARVGVAGEYDGDDHRDAVRHSRDVDRESRLRDAGLEVVRVTARDLRDRSLVVRRLLAAYRRRAAAPTSLPGWTLEPPPWWTGPGALDRPRLSA